MECGRFAECLFGRTHPEQTPAANRSSPGLIVKQPLRASEDAASEFIDILRTAEKGGKDLERRLKNVVTANSWTESFAKLILSGVESLVQHRDTIGRVVKEVMDKAADLAQEIFGFIKDHPVLVTIIAIGILVLIAPWVIEALGFGELGPIAGTLRRLRPEGVFVLILPATGYDLELTDGNGLEDFADTSETLTFEVARE